MKTNASVSSFLKFAIIKKKKNLWQNKFFNLSAELVWPLQRVCFESFESFFETSFLTICLRVSCQEDEEEEDDDDVVKEEEESAPVTQLALSSTLEQEVWILLVRPPIICQERLLDLEKCYVPEGPFNIYSDIILSIFPRRLLDYVQEVCPLLFFFFLFFPQTDEN